MIVSITNIFRMCAIATFAVAAVSTSSAPPRAKVVPFTQTFYGQLRSDPYHWMESGSAALTEYLDQQSSYTRSVIAANPGRARVIRAIRKVNAEAASATTTSGVVRIGSRVFYLQTLANGNDPSLIARSDRITGAKVVINAASLPKGRVIGWFEPSPRGTKIAYGLSASSEAVVIHVCDANGAHDTVQAIDAAVIPDVTWRDERAFYYSTVREGAKNRTETSYLHVVGAKAGTDEPIAGFGARGPMGSSTVRSLFVTYAVLGRDAVLAMPQREPSPHVSAFVAPFTRATRADGPWQRLFGEADRVVKVAIGGRYLYGLSDNGDARRTIDIRDRLSGAHVRTIRPLGDGYRNDIFANRTGVYVAERVGASMRLDHFDLEGRPLGKVALPRANVILALQGDPTADRFEIETASFNDPGRWYEIAGLHATVRDTHISPLVPASYATIRYDDSMATSADGTKIPYTVIYKAGTRKDGRRPTLAIAYGAYGYDVEPPVPPFVAATLELGIVVVLVHARGGGEFGEPWHLAGKGPTKQHTIDDFVAGAQAAIDDGWTSHAKLAGDGGSAGGIAIGGAITQHPDFFAAAISEVGFNDMVDLENMPNGPGNVPEFGSVKTRNGFRDLLAMSAYDHITPAPYPATILTTGLADRRTAPWQVAKMAARLAASTTSGKPILLRTDSQGHGVIRAESEQNEESADLDTFILWQLGEPGFSLSGSTPGAKTARKT